MDKEVYMRHLYRHVQDEDNKQPPDKGHGSNTLWLSHVVPFLYHSETPLDEAKGRLSTVIRKRVEARERFPR